MIANIFCDASIDTNKKIACAGSCLITQHGKIINGPFMKHVILNNATNNSAEILAIWLGICEAIKLRDQSPGTNIVFRLFSDSKISLYGLRDWIQSWIMNAKDGILISSSGMPVMNQQLFISTYNMIVKSNLYISLYHQRGHVKERVSMDKAYSHFLRANRCTPESLGLDIETISNYNNIIDKSTRDTLTKYILSGEIDTVNTFIYGFDPFESFIIPGSIYKYNRYIGKK